METDIQTTCYEYFSNLNPLAKKIATDIENTQEAYQELWQNLNEEERNSVINESIISPSAVIKYANLQITTSKQNPNVYSWFTKSQLNLFDQNTEQHSSATERDKIKTIVDQCSEAELKLKDEIISHKLFRSKSKDENQDTKSNSIAVKSQTGFKSSVLKPKTPPPPPPTKVQVAVCESNMGNEYDVNSSPNDIPKTGFDFLDNW